MFFFLLFVCFAFAGSRANAQMATAQISGTVHDQTGAVVPGAQVTATHSATGIATAAITNDQGFFVLPSLAVGSYSINATATGFEKYRQTGIGLTVGQQLNLRIGLKVGKADEVVTVTADAVAVDSTSPTEQSTVEEKVIQDLPLNGRNPAALTYTVAGVTDSTLNLSAANTQSGVKAADAASPSESAPSVHGSRPGGTYFSLDGASNTDPFTVIGGPFPNPDATGEFSVVTGTYGAQYVSAPGGAINIVTKSGTNDIHGTVFEFLRNGFFNARNARNPNPDVLKRNQYGFAVGAPIIRNKLFIFSTYQSTPIHNVSTTSGVLPTAAQRTGNFGTYSIAELGQIFGSALFSLSPAIQESLQYLPVGPAATSGLLYYDVPANSTDKQGEVKVDLALTNHRIFARAFYDRYIKEANGPTKDALLLGEQSGYIQPWASGALGDSWTFGKWILDSRASFTRVLSTQVQAQQLLSYSNLGVSNMSGYSADPGFGGFYVYGGFYGSNGSATYFPRKQFEISENVFSMRGKHQISFGANYRRISLDETNYTGQNPIEVFAPFNSAIAAQLASQYGIPGIYPSATADLMMGMPYESLQQDGFFMGATGNLFGVHGEDNIHVTKNLTATVGLRWDPYFPYLPEDGRITCFSAGAKSTVFTNAIAGLLYPGDPGCSSGGVESSTLEFQPRAGLAYQVGGKGKTVIRAGYGKYDLQFPLDSYVGFSTQPWVRSYQPTQVPFMKIDNFWASLGTSNPFASGFQGSGYNPPKDIAFQTGLKAATFDSHFRPAYAEQWSLSVQQLLTSTDSIDLAYLGSSGTHLALSVGINTLAKGSRPYPNFSDICSLSSTGTSSYNGVDVTYKHRGKSFTLTSAFSWSKALDDNSQPGSSSAISIPNSNHNFRRGRSDYDQNLVSRTTGTWTSPKLANLNPAIRQVAGSWMLSGLLTLDAGQPFSVTDDAGNSGSGLGIDYADRVAGVPVYLNGKLNPAAFKGNAAGTFGNSGRNAYRGPAYKDMDIAVMKNFPVLERLNATFRAEAFNLFNHPNYLPPGSDYSNYTSNPTSTTTFGAYTSARDPRIMQFSLKLMF
jgi:hypothetical protein